MGFESHRLVDFCPWWGIPAKRFSYPISSRNQWRVGPSPKGTKAHNITQTFQWEYQQLDIVKAHHVLKENIYNYIALAKWLTYSVAESSLGRPIYKKGSFLIFNAWMLPCARSLPNVAGLKEASHVLMAACGKFIVMHASTFRSLA